MIRREKNEKAKRKRKGDVKIVLAITKKQIWAARAIFFVPGAYMAAWAGYVPFLKQNMGIGDDVLGLLILLLGLGSLISMPLAAKIAAAMTCRGVLLLGNIGGLLVLSGITQAAHLWQVAAGLFLFGFFMGLSDVAANLQALIIEKYTARHLMSGLHGGWSIGGFTGAGLMAFFLRIMGFTAPQAVVLVCSALLVLLITVNSNLLRIGADPAEKNKDKGKAPLSFHPLALMIGFLTFISFLIEGAMSDWSALFLNTEKGIDIAVAPLGFMYFNLTMTIGRFLGDAITTRWDPARLVPGGYLCGALGLMAVIFAPPSITMICFALLGIGLANIIPLLFSVLGVQKVIPMGQALSTATTMGYAGVLIGPAFIGFLSHATSLSLAFMVLVGLLVLSIFLSHKAYAMTRQSVG